MEVVEVVAVAVEVAVAEVVVEVVALGGGAALDLIAAFEDTFHGNNLFPPPPSLNVVLNLLFFGSFPSLAPFYVGGTLLMHLHYVFVSHLHFLMQPSYRLIQVLIHVLLQGPSLESGYVVSALPYCKGFPVTADWHYSAGYMKWTGPRRWTGHVEHRRSMEW